MVSPALKKKSGGCTSPQRQKQIATDMVLLSIGVRPETKLAKRCGLAIGERGHAVKTIISKLPMPIYICPRRRSRSTPSRNGQPALIPLAGPANKQGRIVADNIVFGNKKKYPGSIGTSIAKVFDLTVAAAGANAKVITTEQYTPISLPTHMGPLMPDIIREPFPVHQNIVRSGKREIVRRPDCRLQRCRQTYRDAGTSDTARRYSPRPGGIGTCLCTSYSSAKDPVNMAGFVAENIFE